MRQRAGKAKQERLNRLLVWAEQNGADQGELQKDISKEIKKLKTILRESRDKQLIKSTLEELDHFKESIEIFDDDQELFDISRIFVKIPWEYGGFGTPTGKEYQAVKDFLKWEKYKPKAWTSIIVQMANAWITNIP